MRFDKYLEETLASDDELRKEYESLTEYFDTLVEKIKEEWEHEKYSSTPSCGKCICGDKCPVYWHFGNAACNIIYKNKYIKEV